MKRFNSFGGGGNLSLTSCCRAFTLAETLVTLAIIGVVAVLAMPALIQNYKHRVVETRLKKFYTVMNQAVNLAEIDFGDKNDWDYWVEDKRDEEGNLLNRQDEMKQSIEKYFAPYIKIIKIKAMDMGGEHKGEKVYMYFLADGSAFTQARHENREFRFYPKNPEKCHEMELKGMGSSGECSFLFAFKPHYNRGGWEHHYKKGVEPFLYAWNGNPDILYSGYVRSCSVTGHYCTALIQRNGWKVPKDYPRKIKI